MSSEEQNPLNFDTLNGSEGPFDVEVGLEASVSDGLIGRRVGNIEIVSEVGRGNMGTVFKAVHLTLKTPYAVKVLHSKYSKDVTAAERFRREALVCSQLRHPHVVFVTDFGFQTDLGIYIIMEYLDGVPLSEIIEGGPMEAVRVCEIAMQIADALDAAHELKITHRDLKPDNITILDQGRGESVKVLDFGIASMKARQQADITTQGMVLGTPAYMAPEQVRGLKDKLGPRTDIYALGCILYEMLTGRLPFHADSPLDLCRMHISSPAPPVSHLRPDLEGTMLERLVQRMLAKDLNHRSSSMSEVHLVLNEAARQLEEDDHVDSLAASLDFPAANAALGETFDQLPVSEDALADLAKDLWRECPEAALSSLFATVTPLFSIESDIVYLMLWGPMARQALDEPYNGEGFESVMRQVAIFVEHLLEVKLSRGTRTKLFRAFGDLLKLADKRRQYHLLAAVQPLTKHPLFPIEVLPHWATAHASGTWKQVEPPPLSLVKADAGSGAIDWEGELPSLFDLSLTPDEPE